MIESGSAESAIHNEDNRVEYFTMGKVRILVTEHFDDEGMPLTSLLEDMILRAGAAS